jgi:hypothetical protein
MVEAIGTGPSDLPTVPQVEGGSYIAQARPLDSANLGHRGF